ncbi:MAG: hypothetical protein AB1634_18050 [Thermodesulfobacteriota bacterium]
MSISQHITTEFQTKAREAFGSLANEFKLELVQTDEMTFQLVGRDVDVRLYLYPSHIPSVNITLMPKGAQWSKWRRESPWGATGIWLAHLVAFRKAKESCPDSHFRTSQELFKHIEILVQDLRNVGSDLLRGDITALPQLAAYVDEAARRKASEAR